MSLRLNIGQMARCIGHSRCILWIWYQSSTWSPNDSELIQNDIGLLWIGDTSCNVQLRSRSGELDNGQKNYLFRLLDHIVHVSITVMVDIDGKTAVSPLLTYWSYWSRALSHRYVSQHHIHINNDRITDEMYLPHTDVTTGQNNCMLGLLWHQWDHYAKSITWIDGVIHEQSWSQEQFIEKCNHIKAMQSRCNGRWWY